MNTRRAIIIDNGTGTIKCGFSGNSTPTSVFPSIIGIPKRNLPRCDAKGIGAYIGEEAQSNRNILSLKYPILHGITKNWEDMEKIWYHSFYSQLKVSPEEHGVLLTEPPLNPKVNREKTCSIMFEMFNIPLLYLSFPAVLSLYCSGRTTGIVLDSGEGVTNVVPIFEGFALSHSIRRVNLGGRNLTDYLATNLHVREDNFSFRTSSDSEVFRDIKEELCYIALDFEDECCVTDSSHSFERYLLPDGHAISIGDERFRCPEVLFKPDSIGMGSKGIHQLVIQSINSCEIDLRKELHQNIILAGGSTLFKGISERLTKEIEKSKYMFFNSKVVAPLNRKYSGWIGGSIFTSLESFQRMWVEKEEYEESGISIVDRKCF